MGGVVPVRSLRGLPLVPTKLQMIPNVNPLDHEHFVFRLNLPSDFRKQPAVARGNLARLQRAPEGARESPAGRGHDVIKGGCVRLMLPDVNPVMLGYRSVNAEQNRRRLGREIRPPQRSPDAFDANLRGINDVAHEIASFSRLTVRAGAGIQHAIAVRWSTGDYSPERCEARGWLAAR